MKDSLKDFVDQHREGFDDRLPRETSWRKIENNLSNRSVPLWNSITVWRVAAILLFGVTSYLFLSQKYVRPNRTEEAQLQGEFVDLESFYSIQLLEKKELITRYQSETGLNEDEVTQNLQKLEAMYQVLKKEMKNSPSQDVKDALVLNLLIRMDLLNQQLKKLDRRDENNKFETINS